MEGMPNETATDADIGMIRSGVAVLLTISLANAVTATTVNIMMIYNAFQQEI